MFFENWALKKIVFPVFKEVFKEAWNHVFGNTAQQMLSEARGGIKVAIESFLNQVPIGEAKTTGLGAGLSLVVIPFREFWQWLEPRFIKAIKNTPRHNILASHLSSSDIDKLVQRVGPHLVRWFLKSHDNTDLTYFVHGTNDTWVCLRSRVIQLQLPPDYKAQAIEVIPIARLPIEAINLAYHRTTKKVRKYRKMVKRKVAKYIFSCPPQWDRSKIP